jgi:hypothetical protein
MVQCRSLIQFERAAPQMIEPVCYKLEQVMLQTYLMNPKIKVTPLKLPPRKSQEEIACRWEFKMEDG